MSAWGAPAWPGAWGWAPAPIAAPVRTRLPKLTDRLALGATGLSVSPVCLGMTGSAETVLAAFDAGINFFFVTTDLHWPLYEGSRRGLEQLLARGGGIRDRIVVAVVSYLREPLFDALQVHEVVDSVRGLERIDVLVAGAVTDERDLYARARALEHGRALGVAAARATGASFHDRRSALAALNQGVLDLAYVRYNARHDGARRDLFPFLRPGRRGLVYNFKSAMFHVGDESFAALGLRASDTWRPRITDQYRFVLSQPGLDGILASPMTPSEVEDLARALDERPLTSQEQDYMVQLSAAAWRPLGR